MMINKVIKKHTKSILALFVMSLGVVSCYDDGHEPFEPPTGNINDIQPSTEFTTSLDASNQLTVIFRSYSTDAASYLWDFGDGNTSTEANPNYTYAQGGLYDVKLSTTSSDGLIAKDSTQVGPVFVDFEFTTVDSEVTFNNISTGAKRLTWDFGDGTSTTWNSESNPQDRDFSPTHIYSDVGPFQVTLSVVNFAGDDYSVTKEIDGLVLSTVPDFTFSVSGLEATFTDASLLAVSHAWDFGDGNTSTDVNPVHTYATDGTYEVTLTTMNNAGVSKSKSQFVPVGGVKATFAATLLNGSIDEITGTDLNDNADAFDMTPNSTVKDATGVDVPSPFNTWNNTTLNDWIEANISTSNEAPGGSSTAHTAPRSLKLHEVQRRAYQPFEVEVGVEYTVKLWVRAEGVGAVSVYIMDNEIPDETTLETANLGKLVVTGGVDNFDAFEEYSFTFKATTTTALFYAKPTGAVIDGSNEIWIDTISIETPGF